MALEPGSAPATTAPRWIRAPVTLSVLGGGQNLTHLSYSPADSKSAVASRSASRTSSPSTPVRGATPWRATQPSRSAPVVLRDCGGEPNGDRRQQLQKFADAANSNCFAGTMNWAR